MLKSLKELEANATPARWQAATAMNEDDEWAALGPFHEPDKNGDSDEARDAAWQDAKLLVTLRNLAPKLIALWEAALALDGTRPDGKGLAGIGDILRALEALDEEKTVL